MKSGRKKEGKMLKKKEERGRKGKKNRKGEVDR